MAVKKKRPRVPVESTVKKAKSKSPGYPQYVPAEDIMSKGKRADADMENAKADQNSTIKAKQNPVKESVDSVGIGTDVGSDEDDEGTNPQNEFSVTAEDLEALGPADLNLDRDGGDDEELRHRTTPVDFSAKDLDIPGSELDDSSEAIGSEDEENNSYSLGGDNHDDLEESKP